MTSPSTLRAALSPRSVAVIGASENPNKVGGRPIHYLGRFGFGGAIYPINPNRAEIQGHKSYPDLASLPEAPDLVIVAVPGQAAVMAVTACAERGVKVAIVMASGFGETGPAGRAEEHAMVASARAAGMRLVGPNTQGLANFGTGAIASFSTMFLESPPQDGPVAIVSQSGAMSVVPYGLLRARGIGVRHTHATGNDADVTAAELARAVLEDPAVGLLLLYLESIADAAALAEVAETARRRGVPVVALKAGRTAAGQRAASSHTGALANEDRVVDAFFRRHGIWRAKDVPDLVNAAELYLKGWRPEGRRLVAISNSGASCVMAADIAADLGMPLAALSEETQRELAAVLPGFATLSNPIDITAALLANNRLLGAVLPIVGRDPAADLAMIAIPVAGVGYDVEAFARDTAEFSRATGKPVAMAIPQPSVAAPFRAAGVPVFADETQAIGALHQLARHSDLLRRPPVAPMPPMTVRAPEGSARFLNEAESLALVAAHGIRVVPHRLCRNEAEAREAFRAIGPRVAVKACSAEVPHKSEHGLVALGVASEEAVAAAFTEQWRKLEALGVARDGVIVAAMATAARECALGARLDPVFGPVVMLGDGGKYVEAMPDVAVLLPPFSREDALEALGRLRIAPLFQGVRGEPPLDADALAEAALKLGVLIASAEGRIASIDLNPVMVGARGAGIVVADALVERG
ncbi:MAG TPA: acetate--CoA ligase family protein [Stellaceae bacterium]|jgi:acyl-CoA synthetase (NDP forming)|nr:acetate--CoA ligase family protein [Stellaceae bacterium]